METDPASRAETDPTAAEPRPVARRALALPSIRFVPALYFTYTALVLVTFAFYVPPFQKSDELAHFYRAVSLTNLDLVCKTDADGTC